MEQQFNDTTMDSKPEIRQTSIRWPEDFLITVSHEAKKRRTSVNAIVIEAVARYLNIDVPTAA